MSEPPPGANGLKLASFLPYRIAVMARAMSEKLGAAYADEGLTIPEWRVLAVISQDSSIAARDVVARTPMDKMAVSRAVASLEAKGLIVREQTADRRVSAISLSPEGRTLSERVAAIALSYEARLLDAMSAAERDGIGKGLAGLESAIDRIEASPPEVKAAE
ncbi:MAG: MarR family transcriptional regulator [Parvularculaceae bacterium]|nr:MarR family transcriptional regulator [Parvularculaceae bacterium]